MTKIEFLNQNEPAGHLVVLDEVYSETEEDDEHKKELKVLLDFNFQLNIYFLTANISFDIDIISILWYLNPNIIFESMGLISL